MRPAIEHANIQLFLSAAVLFLVALGLTAPVKAGTLRELDLLRTAHRMPGRSIWTPTGTHDFFEYFWLSNQSIIAVTGHSMQPIQLILADARNGRRKTVNYLVPGVGGEMDTRHNLLIPISLAPDSRTFLGFFAAVPAPASYEVFGVGSKFHRRWFTENCTDDLHWMPDGQHWFCWDRDTDRIEMYGLNRRKAQFIAVSGLPSPVNHGSWTESVGQVVGVTPQGTVILMTGSAHEVGAKFTFYTFQAEDGANAKKIGTMQFPDNLIMSDIALSPQGNKLAWQLEANDFSSSHKVSIWTSGIDCSHKSEVGTTHVDAAKFTLSSMMDMSGLAWSPDGKRISFVYHDLLWTAPVD